MWLSFEFDLSPILFEHCDWFAASKARRLSFLVPKRT